MLRVRWVALNVSAMALLAAAPALASSPDVLASAWVSPGGSKTTLVLINASTREQVVDFAPGLPFELTRTVFDGDERFASLGPQAGSAHISLPPRSMATARY